MATLYFFVGYPGSGKTTVANYICETTGATHIWADRERQKMFSNPTHSQAESDRLYAELNERTNKLLTSDHDVVFDTNFSYRKDRDRIRSIAAAAGAEVRIIHMTTPVELARKRARHGDHAERNGMSSIMSMQTFQGILGHLEPLGSDEPYIELDGSDLSKTQALQALELS